MDRSLVSFRSRERRPHARAVLCSALAGVVFLADVIAPERVAVGVLFLYLPILVAAERARAPRFVGAFTIACTILLLIGWRIGTDDVPTWPAAVTRSGAVAAVWLVCALLIGRLRSHRRIEASAQNARLLSETSQSATLLVDDAGRILHVNRHASDLFGYRPEELVGSTVEMLVPHPLRVEHRKHRAAFSAEPQARPMGAGRDLRAVRRDGTEVPVEIGLNPIETERGSIVAVTIIDIDERKRAEGLLREWQKQVQLLLDSTAEAICGIDMDGCFTFFNQTCLQILGYAHAGEVVGKSMHDLIHHTRPDGRPYPAGECRLHQAFRDGTGVHSESEMFWRADGKGVSVECWSHPIQRGNTILGAVVTFIDITNRMETARALERRNRILEMLNHMSLSLSGQLELQKLLRLVVDAGTFVTGAEWGAFFPAPQRPDDTRHVAVATSGAVEGDGAVFASSELLAVTLSSKGIIRCADVTTDPVYATTGPSFETATHALLVRSYLGVPVASRSGEILGCLVFGHARPVMFEDATTEQLAAGIAAQAAVAFDNARLYEAAQAEIGERRRAEVSLLASERALHEADRRKDEFLALLGHELRGPLAPLASDLELIRLLSTDNPRLVTHVHRMRRQLDQLVRLTDDLLDIARLTQGKLHIEKRPTHLSGIVIDAVNATRGQFESRRQTLQVTEPSVELMVMGDHARLVQSLVNVLANASKYTADGGRVALAAGATGSEVWIRVRDEGIGIAPEFLSRVFEKFSQANPRYDRHEEGLGIGLALVRSVVEMHAGHVEARSEGTGCGSEFIFRLPLLTLVASDDARYDAGFRTSTLKGRRVLVVDDNKDTRESLAEWLTVHGHDVRVAADGDGALATVGRFRPEVVLLDIGLPNMDGYAVARRLEYACATPRPLVVAITGYGQAHDRLRAKEAGFDAHLLKPVDLAALEVLLAER